MHVRQKGWMDYGWCPKMEGEPAGSTMMYDDFLFYLKEGREIEFFVEGEEYFLGHSPEGRAIWSGKQVLGGRYEDPRDERVLLEPVINGKSVKELAMLGMVKVETIF